jgi:hypothetical protein
MSVVNRNYFPPAEIFFAIGRAIPASKPDPSLRFGMTIVGLARFAFFGKSGCNNSLKPRPT